MSNKSKVSDELQTNARYEYRVWGKHRKASRKLAAMASDEVCEEIEDWYLLVEDDCWNAKVRGSRLKLKQLVAHKRGFQSWVSDWPGEAAATPAPFDAVFEDLSLDQAGRDNHYDLSEAMQSLDADSAARAVFVTKRRRRYRIGSIRAEVTKIDVEGSANRLHTVAVQGDNLKDLTALLRSVGLDGLPNVPMHIAIAKEAS